MMHGPINIRFNLMFEDQSRMTYVCGFSGPSVFGANMFLRMTHDQFKYIFFEFGKRLSGTMHSPLTANFAVVPMGTPVYLNT